MTEWSFRKALFGVALVAATATAIVTLTAGPAQAIAKGEDAPEGAYPFAVALSFPKIAGPDGTEYASACSGALVAPKWVVTAGHCAHDGNHTRISGTPRYPIIAAVGQDALSDDDGTTVDVVRIVQNPDTDLALLELAEPVLNVEPLPVSTDKPEAGDEIRLAGWGAVDGVADLSHRPDHLQTAEYEVTRVGDVEMFVEATGPDTLTSACPFDSGAPYFRESDDGPELVATEITGPLCPHSSEEQTTRADVLGEWIANQVRDNLESADEDNADRRSVHR